MRYSFAALLAAIMLAPAPADAAGQGRVEVRTGYDDFENVGGFLYGIGAGYDFDLGRSLTLGVEATVEESTADLFILDARRDLGAGIRLGIKTGETGRVYLGAGYSNARVTATGFGSGNADGIRGSAGYEFGLFGNIYGKLEYRYTNYEAGFDRHQGLTGVGIRF